MLRLRPSDFKRGSYVRDTKTDQLALIVHMEDSRHTAKIMYSLIYRTNGKRVRVGFYKLSNRFKPDKAATVLYAKA